MAKQPTFDLTQLLTNPDNPRYMQPERFEALKKSIKDFPKMMELRPIIYNPETMIILGGNFRHKALLELGRKKVPMSYVKAADKLTSEEQRRFVVVDNSEFGEWAKEELIKDFDNDLLNDWGVFDIINDDIKLEGRKVVEFLAGDGAKKTKFTIEIKCESESEMDAFFIKLKKIGYNCKKVTA